LKRLQNMVDIKNERQNKRQLEDEESAGSNKRTRTGEETVEVSLLVESNAIGQVIGKGGETIKSIKAESGASIYTSKFLKDVGVRTVRVTGTIEQVCTGIRMIIDIIAKDNPAVTLLAEYRNLGVLIGKQGTNIKQLREESGARIFITKECIGVSTQKEIQISGDYESVMKAVETVVSYLADARNPTGIPYVPGESQGAIGGMVKPPFSALGIGGGGRFNQLLAGGGANQGMGFQEQALTSGLPSVCRIETTMYVPKEFIGPIIGRGGANIKAVRMRSSAQIFVDAGEDGDESPERKIILKGKWDAIDRACMMIEDMVNQRR